MGNVKETIKKLISALGGKFSKELGIDLSKGFLQKYSSGSSPRNSLAPGLALISPLKPIENSKGAVSFHQKRFLRPAGMDS